MIEAAHQLMNGFPLKGRADFLVADVTHLNFRVSSFDVVISQRCLLNLPSREKQWKAMGEISRILKRGGRYLMIEGTLQGLRNLNRMREMFGLEAIPANAPNYNWCSNKFDEDEMLEVTGRLFAELEYVQRFGMYYFISRIIHPLLVSPEQPRYDARINEIARRICSRIPNYDDLGGAALFVFRR